MLEQQQRPLRAAERRGGERRQLRGEAEQVDEGGETSPGRGVSEVRKERRHGVWVVGTQGPDYGRGRECRDARTGRRRSSRSSPLLDRSVRNPSSSMPVRRAGSKVSMAWRSSVAAAGTPTMRSRRTRPVPWTGITARGSTAEGFCGEVIPWPQRSPGGRQRERRVVPLYPSHGTRG